MRLNEDGEPLLTEQAEAEGSPEHEAARQLVVERSARLRLDLAVPRSATRGASRYGELLDRLGKA
jgi:hypothetical protein